MGLKDKKGSSKQAIVKHIMANNNMDGADAKAINSRTKLALKKGLEKGTLKNSKGAGVTGSFKLAEKPKVKKVKKPKAKKPAAKAKKPAAKAKKAKSPKKAAKKSPAKKAKPAKKAPAKKAAKAKK